MSESNSFTYKLTPEQQDETEQLLGSGNYKRVEVPHTRIAVQGEDCRINLYNSGKLLIQGKGSRDFIQFILEPEVLKEARLGYEEILNPEAFTAHIGVDESGKGDFFGPMVIVSAYMDETLVEGLKKIGVKDSKNITSDKKAMALAKDLRNLLGDRFSVVTIGPRKYNELYAKIRNVNRLLAWAHAQAIENLVKKVPDCPRALSDKFGHESLILQALKKKGVQIELEQKHKAESDMAVAAASIIARAAFLDGLKKIGERYKLEIPKGASAKVKDVAEEMIKAHGPEALLESCKCHFRTTEDVLSRIGKDRTALGEIGQVTSRPRQERE